MDFKLLAVLGLLLVAAGCLASAGPTVDSRTYEQKLEDSKNCNNHKWEERYECQRCCRAWGLSDLNGWDFAFKHACTCK